MSDIPHVIDFVDTFDTETDLSKWSEFTKGAIARCIQEHADALKSGSTIYFKFPVLRDMGKYKKLWVQHYPEMVTHLAIKKWVVEADVRPPDVQLKISLPLNLVSDKSTSQT